MTLVLVAVAKNIKTVAAKINKKLDIKKTSQLRGLFDI